MLEFEHTDFHGEVTEELEPRIALKMPPPNLKPDFEDQARSFVDGVVDEVFDRPMAASAESSAPADADSAMSSS